MSRTYIFGIGSPFGADRIGWQVIHQLRAHFVDRPDVILETLSQPTNIFIHTFEATDRIIFIDAMISGRAPGSLEPFTARQLESASPRLSSHGIDLKTTVELLIGMGFLPNQIIVMGIEVTPDGCAFLKEAQSGFAKTKFVVDSWLASQEQHIS